MNRKLTSCQHKDDLKDGDPPPPRTDASFTEIYELIFYNDSLVRPELEVLKRLIQNKLKTDSSGTSTKHGHPEDSVYNKQAMLCRT